MPRGADGVVQALKEAGVSTIFGIPSIHNIGLYESLRHEPSIRHIGCRHEAGATHMADGYARASGGLGVIVSSTGPGAGFTVSALQEAWGSCSPVLMITTNIDAAKIGKGLGVLHELEEQTALFRTITKEVIVAQTDDDLGGAGQTRHCPGSDRSARPGVFGGPHRPDGWRRACGDSDTAGQHSRLPRRFLPGLTRRSPFCATQNSPSFLLERTRPGQMLPATSKPWPKPLCAPVITNTPGKGVVPEDHALAFGNAARRMVVKEIVPGCDAAIVIGSRLREVDAKRRGLVLPEQLIHIDWGRALDQQELSSRGAAGRRYCRHYPSATQSTRRRTLRRSTPGTDCGLATGSRC